MKNHGGAPLPMPIPSSSGSERKLIVVGVAIAFAVTAVLVWGVMVGRSSARSVPEQDLVPEVSLSANAQALAAHFQPYTGAIAVLSYSGVDALGTGSMLTPSEFAQQMEMLDQAGFATVTDEQVRAFTMGEKISLPQNPVLITFDRSSEGVWTAVDPILAQHGYSAEIFLTSFDLVDGSEVNPLNRDTLQAMKSSGRWRFGVQVDATTLERRGEPLSTWENRVRIAMSSSRAALDSALDVRAISMSYPYSDGGLPIGDPAVKSRLPELVGEQFDLGFLDTSRSTLVTVEVDKTLVPRIPQTQTTLSPEALLGAIDDAAPRTPPSAVDDLRWEPVGDGTCLWGGGTLVIAAETSTVCRLNSSVVQSWDDVSLSAITSGISNSTAAGFQFRERALDQIQVLIGAQSIVVQKQDGGVWSLVSRTDMDTIDGDGVQALLIELRGSRLQVTIDEKLIVDADVGPSTGTGRVSVSVAANQVDGITLNSLIVKAPPRG